jgi:hypothetical protein
MVLQLFLECRGIDLAHRMQQGRVLEVGEIDELVRLCRLPLSGVIDNTAVNAQLPTTQRHKAEPLERVRMRLKTPLAEIAPASAAIRLIYIREYVGWLATGQMLRLSITHPARAALESAVGAFISAIGARIPPTSIRRGVGQREGLSHLGRIERGDNNVAILTLIKIASALGYSANELLAEAAL